MKQIEMSQKKWIASMVGCAIVGSALGSVGLSFADNMRSTSNILDQGVVLPYDGYLMLDSSPVNKDDQQVRFSLYESVSGGTAQWVETQTVNVVNGKFSVALGSDVANKVSSSPANATFSDVILDAQRLFIGIEVLNDQGQFVELSGRQAIQPAPYAAWSARSADFKAEGDLTVQGVTRPQNGIVMRDDTSISGVDQIIGHNDLRFSGSPSNTNDLYISSSGDVLMRRSLSVQNTVTAQGKITGAQLDGPYSPSYSTWNANFVGSGGAAIVNDNSAYKALMVVGNTSAGGLREVRLYDNLTINNSLTVGGNITPTGQYKNLRGSMISTRYQKNNGGTLNMINVSEGFCALSQMTTGAGSSHECSVQQSGGWWTLYNNEDTSAGRYVNCQAYCVILP